MSLINDAIKRANQTVSQRQTPLEGVRLKPVDSPKRPNVMPLILIPVLVVLLLSAGGWLLWQGLPWGKKDTTDSQTPAKPATTTTAKSTSPGATTTPVKTTTTPSSNAGLKPKPDVTPTLTATPPSPLTKETPKPTPSAQPKPSTTSSAPPPVVAIAPPPLIDNNPPTQTTPASTPSTSPGTPTGPPPEFPALKLQGIYYRRVNPSALINGETVFVGDVIKGIKVVAIERSAVTLELNGYKKVITFQ